MSQARAARERTRRTCRVLVADADSGARELYREWLRPAGCDVIDAADGRDALVSALVHRPSLVIAETRLPVFDAYQLLNVLKRDVVTRSVPVVVVTAESAEEAVERARKAGADAVLIKPVSPEALLREVQRLLNQTPPEVDRPTRDTASHRRSAAAHAVATTTPPAVPPTLICPLCDRHLTYEFSYVGGVRNTPEQWDMLACATCGRFEFRHRTRHLRAITADTTGALRGRRRSRSPL